MKIRQFKLATILVASVFIFTGCGSQAKSNSASSHKTTDSSVNSSKKIKQGSSNKSSEKTSSSSSSSAKKVSTLWNNSKDEQLETFINKWAPTMKQTYTKYDGTNSLKTSVGSVYPDDLSKVNVNGEKTSIGWSKDGEGNYTYNVVAIYNYDGTEPPMPNHITYFFAFRDGQPVVLVDQSRDGTPDLGETQNTQVRSNFAKIADSNSETSTTKSASDSKQTGLVRDPKSVGVMLYEKSMPGDDVVKETELGVYIFDNRYCIDIGNAQFTVMYKINGNNVTYWTKENSSSDAKQIKHTISLKQLESQYYSTSTQKKAVQETAGRMPKIETETN